MRLQYVPPSNPDNQAAFELLRDSGVLDDIVRRANVSLALPTDIVVSVEDASDATAPFYASSSAAIVYPPQFVALTKDLLLRSGWDESMGDISTAVLAVQAFVLLHELGHALIDTLDLPVTGREEDAVDELATILTAGDRGEGGLIALSGAVFFGALGSLTESVELEDFWDEHSLHEQRSFGIVCWVYGSNPRRYAEIAAQSGIGKRRLARCANEYRQKQRAWRRLLAPFTKDAGSPSPDSG